MRGYRVRLARSPNFIQLAGDKKLERANTEEIPSLLEKPEEESRGPSDLVLALRELRRRPPAVFGLFCILVVIAWALFPEFFSPANPFQQNLKLYLKSPGYMDSSGIIYYLGYG